MTYATEFPDFADMPTDIPAAWLDVSWRNDACPAFEVMTAGQGDSNYQRCVVWIAEADQAQREFPNGKRFLVAYYDGTLDCFDAMASDDWQAVVSYVETRRLLASRYVELIGYNPFLDCPAIAPDLVAESVYVSRRMMRQ